MVDLNKTKIKTGYIKIRKEDGEALFKFLSNFHKNLEFIDKKYKIIKQDDFLLFPLVNNKILIKKILETTEIPFNYEIVSKKAISNPQFTFSTLEGALRDVIPEKHFNLIPRSYDIIGNIAIVEFNKYERITDENLEHIKKKIAKAIILINKRVKTVYEKKSEIKGDYRLRELYLIYGPDKPETFYKENGCVFKLDVKKTFFTPRLIYERKRLSSLNLRNNELIGDLFAGVGPFSIQIAKKHNIEIFAFDINPVAYNLMIENIQLNKLKGNIIPHHIDIKKILDPSNHLNKSLNKRFDRIIMNFPEKSLEFLNVAVWLIKRSGGILHFYQFSEKPDSIEKALNKTNNLIKKLNWEIQKVLNSRIVKSYSPNSELVVLDLFIKPNNQ